MKITKSNFNAKQVKDDIVEWIIKWFEKNGSDCNAIIGLSGGKDSSIVAALCTEALGKDRVIGISLPEDDELIGEIDRLTYCLGIRCAQIPIQDIKQSFLVGVNDATNFLNPTEYQTVRKTINYGVSENTKINLPARIRMTMLYAIAQSMNGRVANTCNLSEDYVGYSTRYGDSVGDFSPLSNLTVTEVKEIGRVLELPKTLIEKIPEDGLSGKTDEENLGFSYDVLDLYIREGIYTDINIKNQIVRLHEKNQFKLKLMDSFPYPF